MSSWSQLGLQEGMSPIIELISYFHDHIMLLICIIFTFVSVIFCSVLVSSGVDHYLLDSHMLEFIWTVVPMVFLLFIALPSLYLLYLTEDVVACTLAIKVVAHQWFWEYEYYNSSLNYMSYMLPVADDSTRLLDVDNRVCVPTMSSTIIIVTSADVLHSWALPSLGVKVDAIPGRLNYLNLSPTHHGLFYGQCSELCGSNHSFMPIVVEVTSYSGIVNFLSSL